MSSERYQTFEQFWPFYVGEHSLSATRNFHFIGTTCAIVSLTLLFVTGHWWWLPTTFISSYGFAWFSHFFIEKNRPATFSYPLYSLRADFRMYGLMWRGR